MRIFGQDNRSAIADSAYAEIDKILILFVKTLGCDLEKSIQ